MDTINYEHFSKIKIRVGTIESCEKLPNADKLLKLIIDFGDERRQILSAIAEWYKPEDLIGKQIPVLVNLEPRMMRGEESQGMILAADSNDGPVLLLPEKKLENGSSVV